MRIRIDICTDDDGKWFADVIATPTNKESFQCVFEAPSLDAIAKAMPTIINNVKEKVFKI